VADEALRRARGQWLHRPGGDVVGHLLAVQAQDARAARLALRARGALEEDDGEHVVTWLMRTTLHLVREQDVHWLHPLFAPRQVTSNRRRLSRLGVSEAQAERAVGLIVRALADEGSLTRAELGERLAARDIPVAGQAIAHLVHRAAIEGRVALTPDRRFTLLELRPAPDRDRSLAELARRYLAAHAGATDTDLAYWSGLPLRDVRAGLAHAKPPPADDGPVPLSLIPAFDELLLGWRDRSPTVPPEHARRVHPGGGILRAVVLENGVAVGTWSLRAGEITIDPFDDRPDLDRLLAEADPRVQSGEWAR
jgi:hypothetical protein